MVDYLKAELFDIIGLFFCLGADWTWKPDQGNSIPLHLGGSDLVFNSTHGYPVRKRLLIDETSVVSQDYDSSRVFFHSSQLARLYINVAVFNFFLKEMVQLSLCKCQSHFWPHAQLQVVYSCVVGTARSTENHSSKCKS